MASDSNPPPTHRVPKLGHKKSMFGCQRCRARRCNEAKPSCHNCERFGLPCIYDRDAFATPSEKSIAARLSPGGVEDDDPPESRARRMLETRLMHQYLIETGSTIAAGEYTREVFARVIPRLSLDSDALLYSMYAISALHLQKLGRSAELEGGAEDVASRYSSMAVREHNKDLSKITGEIADVVCLTSCLMRCIALIRLQGRNLQPYVPPWQWLVLTQTSTSIFMEAWERVGPDPNSVAYQLIKGSLPLYEKVAMPGRRNLGRLKHLLVRSEELDTTEPWNPETEDAYERTLDYICTAINMSENEGSSGSVFRVLVMFPMVADRRFVEQVKAGSPRALVILAHYFALLVGFKDVWWVGQIGADEVRAIIGVLPDQWQGLLAWPRQAIEKK